MKILSFDCSSKTMSAVIGEGNTVFAADYAAENRNHAPYLMPMIDSLLKQTNTDIHDIELIGVTIGPGSFTGLRIGLATAMGFSDMLDVPLVPLCSLDALAENYREHHGILIPLLDARKKQVYAAVYDNREGKMKKILAETPLSPVEELAEFLKEQDDLLFFGDGVPGWRDMISDCYGQRCSFGEEERSGIRGEGLLRLTAEAKESTYTRQVMPLYLRGVDAKAKFANFQIAPMKTADIPELLELEKTAFPTPWTEGMFKSELSNGFGHYWVMRTEGKITAYCGFWLVSGECHITNIAVHEDFRNMGQGRAMLEYLLEMAKLYGVHGVTLEVRPSNTVALALYRSHGFQQEGRRKHYYEDNGEDALIMWLHFPDRSNEKPWRI